MKFERFEFFTCYINEISLDMAGHMSIHLDILVKSSRNIDFRQHEGGLFDEYQHLSLGPVMALLIRSPKTEAFKREKTM